MKKAQIPTPFLLLFLWVVGCQTTPSIQTTIQEGSLGKVYLKTVAQDGFQASHPISLPLETIHKILGGVKVREHIKLFQRMLSGNAEAFPVFTEPDLSFLAKGFQTGLQQASPQEVIEFALFHEAKSASEATEGTLYHLDSSVHLTLTKISFFDEPGHLSRPRKHQKDINGLQGKELTFSPESALRSSSSFFSSQEPSRGNTIVISYSSFLRPHHQKLQSDHALSPEKESDGSILHQNPGETSTPTTPLPANSETLQGVVIKQQQEIHDLQQELKNIRQDLQKFQNTPSP